MNKQTEHTLYEKLKAEGARRDHMSFDDTRLEMKAHIDRILAGYNEKSPLDRVYYDIDYANSKYNKKEFRAAVRAYERCMRDIRTMLREKFVAKLFLYRILIVYRYMRARQRIA